MEKEYIIKKIIERDNRTFIQGVKYFEEETNTEVLLNTYFKKSEELDKISEEINELSIKEEELIENLKPLKLFLDERNLLDEENSLDNENNSDTEE